VSRLGDAVKTFEHFENYRYLDIKPDKATYAIMLNSCAGTGAVQDALTLLKEMEGKKIPVDTFVYNSFLRVCQYAKTTEERQLAFDVFSKMEGSQHAKPNAVTYTIMLKVVNGAGKDQLAAFVKQVGFFGCFFFFLGFFPRFRRVVLLTVLCTINSSFPLDLRHS